MAGMAVTREIEPWEALLESGDADERLVAQAVENARPATTVPLPSDLHPELSAGLRRAGLQQRAPGLGLVDDGHLLR